jgi:hypothetical protein
MSKRKKPHAATIRLDPELSKRVETLRRRPPAESRITGSPSERRQAGHAPPDLRRPIGLVKANLGAYEKDHRDHGAGQPTSAGSASRTSTAVYTALAPKKRLSAPYRSGPSRDWLKVKNPDSPAMVRAREAE